MEPNELNKENENILVEQALESKDEKEPLKEQEIREIEQSYVPFKASSMGSYQYGAPPQGNPYSEKGEYSYTPNMSYPQNAQSTPSFDAAAFYERQEKKRQIKSLGNGVGMPLSLVFLGSNIINYIFSIILIAVLGLEGARALLSNADFLYVVSALISVLVLTVPFLFTAKFIGAKLKDIVSLRLAPKGLVLPTVMLGLGICGIGNIASSTFGYYFEKIFKMPPQDNMVDYNSGWQSFILMLICIGIFPAILEEFAFRSVILGSLRKYMSDGAAIMVSAALFGLLHGNLVQIPFAFIVGIGLAYCTVYTGSVIPAMIIHGINNALSVVLTYVANNTSPLESGIISILYLVVLLLVGVCGLILLLKIDSGALKLSKERSEETSTKVGWFCGSAWMIVFFILCGLSVLANQLLPYIMSYLQAVTSGM